MRFTTLVSMAVSALVLMSTQFSVRAADHPYYLHALSDLRAARWMIEHRPGNWELNGAERSALENIKLAMKDIITASLDDGQNPDDHPGVDERPDRAGRLHEAIDFLQKARADVNQEEDNNFAGGLKGHALKHISEALRFTRIAVSDHPHYLQALSDLRAAHWLIEQRPDNAPLTDDERSALHGIALAMKQIIDASMDDGLNPGEHPPVDEHPDHVGRLHAAAVYLEKARADVNQEEDENFAGGLKGHALKNISEAIRFTQHAINPQT